MLGCLLAQMYARNQVIAYPPGLHISKATEIKIVIDKVFPRLPIRDVAKKKGFKIYHYVEMPSRKMKVKVVNILKNWSFLFGGMKLIQDPYFF